MKTWHTYDKTDWDDGPWKTEPDKAVWVDEATDLDCMIVRNRYGSLCGYVGIGLDHPLHGEEFVDVDLDADLCCRLSYSAGCNDTGDEATDICHRPEPGRPRDVWWFGFAFDGPTDLQPAMNYRLAVPAAVTERYSDFAYVKREVEHLARQLDERR